MPTVAFTLSPTSLQRLHDALVCLSKFSETVTMEFYKNRLHLTALNSSKSSFASITLQGPKFFDRYQCSDPRSSSNATATISDAASRFTCKLLTRSLLSVFRQRGSDFKDKGTGIEKCEVEIRDNSPEHSLGSSQSVMECRMNIRMLCKHGVVKTYRLTYEDAEGIHVMFDKEAATHHWKIESGILKEYLEHFGSRADQLGIAMEEERAIFKSFTEKLMDGNEILKQPLKTTIALSIAEFESKSDDDSLNLSIPMKDFKTIIHHSDSLKASVTAYYDNPGQPLQLVYERDGLVCAYTIMTRPDEVGEMAPPIKEVSRVSRGTTRARTSETVFRGRGERETPSHLEPAKTVAPIRKPTTGRDRSETPPETGPYVEQSSFADFAEVQGSTVAPRGLLDPEDDKHDADESVTWDLHGEGGGVWKVQDRRTGTAGKRRRSEDDVAGDEGVVGPTQASNAPKGLFD